MAQQGLAEARNLGLRDVEPGLFNTLALAAGMQGDELGGLELDGQSLLVAREVGDRAAEAIYLRNQGNSWMNLGHLVQARWDLDAALQIAQALGDKVSLCIVLAAQAELALFQGDDPRALALARQALDLAVAARSRDDEVKTALQLGHAELALGRSAAARNAYAQAHARAVDDYRRHDTSAGLARGALAEGDAAAAMVALKPVLDHDEAGGTLEGTEGPRRIELSCYLVLAHAGDPRATAWLVRAHGALMAQADAISRHATYASLREGFLQNIPIHREIMAAWAQREAAGESPAGPAG